jgi:hypothetical protein
MQGEGAILFFHIAETQAHKRNFVTIFPNELKKIQNPVMPIPGVYIGEFKYLN